MFTPLDKATKMKPKHTIQVTSYGGCGTTTIYDFLDRLNLDIPTEKDYGTWKHIYIPPSIVRREFKAIYIFGNPLNVILSLFRRQFQIFHLERMGIKPFERNTKALTINEYVNKYPYLQIFSSLEKYIAHNYDYYRLDEHFTNWTTSKRHYPIMVVKYETLWNHLDEIFKFLGIPDSEITNFPKQHKRNSVWQKQPQTIKKKLLNIYGNIYNKTTNYDEIKIL